MRALAGATPIGKHVTIQVRTRERRRERGRTGLEEREWERKGRF